ncbi:MAG TPA: hypothetical protein V6C76_11755 [Drouetiella sp.]
MKLKVSPDQPSENESVPLPEPKPMLTHEYKKPETINDEHVRNKEKAEQHRKDFASLKAAEASSAPLPDEQIFVERCKEVSFELPDGRAIEMAPPQGNSAIFAEKLLSNRKFEDEKLMSLALMTCRAILHIRTIDGAKIDLITVPNEYNHMCNRLGDEGIDAVFAAYMECFPPLQRQELKLVKKF